MRNVTVTLSLLLLAGCLHDNRASRDRGAAGLFENVPVYRAPAEDRCAKQPKNTVSYTTCVDSRTLAQTYVRRLSTGDPVCLQDGFGEVAGAACLARAAVVDSADNRVLLEIREAKPDSKWFNREQNQFWFEEGALVDLYLEEHGY